MVGTKLVFVVTKLLTSFSVYEMRTFRCCSGGGVVTKSLSFLSLGILPEAQCIGCGSFGRLWRCAQVGRTAAKAGCKWARHDVGFSMHIIANKCVAFGDLVIEAESKKMKVPSKDAMSATAAILTAENTSLISPSLRTLHCCVEVHNEVSVFLA